MVPVDADEVEVSMTTIATALGPIAIFETRPAIGP
jgi:hypothetical protein